MKQYNTTYKADIVLEPTIGGYNIWNNDQILGSMTPEGRKYIFSRLDMQQCSIFDMEREQFVSGTIEQLTQGA